MSRRLRFGLVITVALAGAVLVLIRTGVLFHSVPRSVSEMSGAQLADYAQALYQQLPMATADSLHSSEDYAGVLRNAAIEVYDDWTEQEAIEARDEIAAFVGAFLYQRFGQSSVESYKAWRREQGYELVPTSILIEGWQVPETYEYHYDEPYPGDDHFEEVFDRFWSRTRPDGEAPVQLVALASTVSGLDISFGVIGPEDPGNWHSLEGELGFEVWHGRTSGTHRNWWSLPNGGFRDRLTRGQRLRVALVGMVMEFDNQVRLPLQLYLFYDSQSGLWRIKSLTVNNDVRDTMPIIEY